LSVLLAASLWVTLATYKSLPISTSQSIVGAVAGFGAVSILLGDINPGFPHLLYPLVGLGQPCRLR
ncbi:MAG: inorganic phosphate transporter, partial [Planctomycetes bacterium]|nr:inorganic phosphate transporter [Planctomycetota bacterium]